MTEYNYTLDYNDSSLTRGEALDMIDDADGDSADALDALKALAHLWLGHNQQGFDAPHQYADFLREYVAECCMDMDGDAIRANGPRDSDYTGISS